MLAQVKSSKAIMASRCVVRRHQRGPEDPPWLLTSARTASTGVAVIFKLFEVLQHEFAQGRICPICHQLVSEVDHLQAKTEEAKSALRERVLVLAEDEEPLELFIGDEEEPAVGEPVEERVAVAKCEEEVAPMDPALAPSRRRRRGRASLVRVKRERPDEEEHQINPTDYLQQLIKKESVEQEDRKPAHRLEEDLIVTRTTRDKEMLVYRGHTFLRARTEGNKVKWKCSHYYAAKGLCSARLTTSQNGKQLWDDSDTGHNHPPMEEDILKGIFFRERVRRLAADQRQMRPQDVLANVRAISGHSGSTASEGSLLRFIQRVRSRGKGKNRGVNIQDFGHNYCQME